MIVILILKMHSVHRVHFSKFLSSAKQFHQHVGTKDISRLVKQLVSTQRYEINPVCGKGYVFAVPLMAGSTLVVMDFIADETVEVYQEK